MIVVDRAAGVVRRVRFSRRRRQRAHDPIATRRSHVPEPSRIVPPQGPRNRRTMIGNTSNTCYTRA